MRTSRPYVSVSSVLRYALLASLVGSTRVLAQFATACVPIPTGDDQHGDSDADSSSDDGDFRSLSSWSLSFTFCGSATATSTSGSGANLGGNTDISENRLGAGPIAGIVIGLSAFTALALLLTWCLRRRYTRRQRLGTKVSLTELRESTGGAGMVGFGAPAGQLDAKEARATTMTMTNEAPNRFPPGLHRASSLLAPLPYASPAYTSTEHLASPRNSTVLSYISPSVTTGATAGHGPALSYSSPSFASRSVTTGATAGHGTVLSYVSPSVTTGSTGATAGHGPGASLHEDMFARQKELESNYHSMERGDVDGLEYSSGGSASGSGLGYNAAAESMHEPLPPGPPPLYRE